MTGHDDDWLDRLAECQDGAAPEPPHDSDSDSASPPTAGAGGSPAAGDATSPAPEDSRFK